MNHDDWENDEPVVDEVFDSLVVAYSEALATGVTPVVTDETKLPIELLPQLRSTQAYLSLLDQTRRSRQQLDSQLSSEQERASSVPQLSADGLPTNIGRFQILRELGRGGYGIVFLAFDTALLRQVALKVPRPEVVLTPELSRRFLREAQAAGSLAHPNLVAVYDTGEDAPFCYIASAYCNGPNLAQWIKSHSGPVPFRQAAQMVGALADGIEEAHRRGILHRDIKPSNVLLETNVVRETFFGESPVDGDLIGRAEFVPKLTDFGLAKLLEGRQDETRSTALLGTPAYMAPEQATGKVSDIGPATDIYGLGAILYEMLTGVAPFRGESDLHVLRQIAEEETISPRLIRRDLPRDLEAICLKCLEKQPSRRYTSALALAADLRRFLSGQPTIARTISPAHRAAKWARRRPALAGLITVSAVAVLLLSGLATAYVAEQRLARQSAEVLQSAAEASAETSRQHEQSANQLLYASRMRLAYQWLGQGDVARASELLEPYSPPGRLSDLRGFEWFHLKRRIHGERLTLTGHRGEVYAVAFSPDGRELASGGQDGTIRFWDPESGRELATLHAHSSCVNTLAFSPDGKTLASGSCDHKIKLWNAATHEVIDTLDGHAADVHCVAFAPSRNDRLASSGNEPVVRIWDLGSGEIIQSLDTQRQTVTSLAWRADGLALFLAGNDGSSVKESVLQWGLSSEQSIVTYPYSSWVVASPSHRAGVCIAHANGHVIMKSEGSKEPNGYLAHGGIIFSLAFAPGRDCVASGGDDNTIRVWDTVSNACSETLNGHTRRVASLSWSPDGRALASGSFDGTIKLWDTQVQDRKVQATEIYLAPFPPSAGVAVSADFRHLAVQSRHNQVRIVNLADGTLLSEVTTANLTPAVTKANRATMKATPALHFLAGRPILFVPGADSQTAEEWDFEQRESIKTHSIGAENASALALCASGNTLVTADPTGAALVDTRTGRVFRTFEIQNQEDMPKIHPQVCFSPDGKDCAVTADNGAPSLIIRSGDQQTASESLPNLLAISNRAVWVAAHVGGSNGVVIGDAGSGKVFATLHHGSPVNAAAFSPDARTLATVCSDGMVYLWNVRTGQEITRLETHAGIGLRVQFSPDGRHLAAVLAISGKKYSDPAIDEGRPVQSAYHATARVFVWNGLDGE